MTHAAYTPQVQHYRWYDDDGGEAASSSLALEDSSYNLDVSAGNQVIHLRLMMEETGGDTDQLNNTVVQLRYNKNGTGDTNVTASSQSIMSASGSQLTDDGVTTNRSTDGLTDGSGTFVAGVQEEGDGAFTTQTELTAGNFTEYVWAITVIKGDVSDGDSITFDITEDGAAPTFNVTPTLTITKTDTTAVELASTVGKGQQTPPHPPASLDVSNQQFFTIDPVALTAKEAVNIGFWWQPASEPIFLVPQVNSGSYIIDPTAMVEAEEVSGILDWWIQAGEPVRLNQLPVSELPYFWLDVLPKPNEPPRRVVGMGGEYGAVGVGISR